MSRFARLGLGAGSTKVHADGDFQSRPQQGNRETYSFKPHVGVHRVDTVFWPANYPAEDVLTSLYVQPMSWSFWSVYDGHVGPQAAWHLEKHLLQNLAESLHALYSKGVQPHTEAITAPSRTSLSPSTTRCPKAPPSGPWQRALSSRARWLLCFGCILRQERAHPAHLPHRRLARPPRPGAQSRRRKDERPLTPPSTRARSSLRGPATWGGGSRARSGTAVMKWSRELQSWMKERCLGSTPRDTLLTPPYFTAEPEITSTAVEPGDFLVMASRRAVGRLTNEEVVGLVGLWLERNENVSNATLLPEEEQAIERAELPVTLQIEPTIPTGRLRRQDLHVALLSTPSPRARHVRDDVSAIVVFFE
ncbi:hypothetical protein B0H14DRAFT_2846606 [Mycena olivaceomarginata]|nr:hypothetical protein B0H14DRAFT_2846606 [Mycena olivaceomarginata]